MLLPVRQRYKNESKSQRAARTCWMSSCCCQYDKDTKMKANHNVTSDTNVMRLLLPVRQRYKNESKSQPKPFNWTATRSCCQYDKDTKMKANHNAMQMTMVLINVVASTTKIQKWKQITTESVLRQAGVGLLPVRQRYKNESKSQL